MEWISVSDRLPESADESVLAYSDGHRYTKGGWPEGAIDMVHIQDYFDDITCGLDDKGDQMYTKWYRTEGVTHWMPLPDDPKEAK